MTTQLSIYNDALGFIGERSLATTSDATESRRVLDTYYTSARDYCLGQGHWKFAKKRELLTPSLTEIPTFGYANAFAKPTNFVRLSELCADEYFKSPVAQFDERGGYFYSDLEELYIGYVSKHATLGYNLDLWTESFTLYVALYLAVRIAPRLAPDMKVELIQAPGNIGLQAAKENALSKDAVQGGTQFLPPGNWVNSRRNRMAPRNSRASLYGS